jgi:RND superfamily putative drug exporter
MVLVPSIMEVLGPVNWWLPRWMDRSLPRLGIEVTPPPTPLPTPA